MVVLVERVVVLLQCQEKCLSFYLVYSCTVGKRLFLLLLSLLVCMTMHYRQHIV